MDHTSYMHRCLQLAQLGGTTVAPNPMVGAVLVHKDCIIGEGYHQFYGGPHAEVNCLASVKEEDQALIASSTLYVSLEPCAHFGKTPPCAELIIRHKIPEVVIGYRDPFPEVNGKGIEKLQEAGVRVIYGVLEDACKHLNKKFFSFHSLHRPFVTLKWAQTANQKIGSLEGERMYISNDFTNRLVHRERSLHMAILVGTHTALVDDPELTVRKWPGRNPLRLVIDKELKLPSRLKIFNDDQATIIFNLIKHDLPEGKLDLQNLKGVYHYQVTEDSSLVHQILQALYTMQVQSLLVEGGAILHQSFIEEGLWDEAMVITNEGMIAAEGLPAPRLLHHNLIGKENLFTDRIEYFARDQRKS